MLDVLERSSLKHEFSRRRRKYEEITVKKSDLDARIESGWEIVRENISSFRIRRPKVHNVAFEDKVWCILYGMEFQELNSGDNFRIPSGRSGFKQIDVFGMCAFGAAIIECKSSNEVKKRRLRKELAEYVVMKDHIQSSVNSHAGREVDISIIFATRNIIWGEADLNYARENGIQVLQDEDIEYYLSLANHLGAGAQYQFFADTFSGREQKREKIVVPAIYGKIGDNEAFIFSATAEDLLPISHIAHRARVDGNTVTAYQRMVQKARLKSIREHIEENGALFPNSIIVNFHDPQSLSYDQLHSDGKGWSCGILTLPSEYRSAWVIDGQHRLMGLAGTADATNASLPVVGFAGLDSSTQAKIFVDINSKQVRVQNNLLEELYADLLWSSNDPVEQLAALCAKTVGQLDKVLNSPLRGKIKSGAKIDARDRPITITTISTALKKAKLYGHVLQGASQIHPGPLLDLRDPMMENSLARGVSTIISFLDIFKRGAPEHWNAGNEPGGYLCTNNGLVALFIVLQRSIEHVASKEHVSANDWDSKELVERISPLMDPIVAYFREASLGDIHQYRRLLGGSGQVRAAFAMMALINNNYSDFMPRGLDSYLASQDDQYTDKARVIMPKLQLSISKSILGILRSQFGQEDEGWWAQGVPQQVRIKVAQRRESDPERPRLDQSFDLLDYKAVVNANWEIMGAKFGLKSLGNGKAKQLSWFQELNEIRNRVAHPERGQVSREELEWIVNIAQQLEPAIGIIEGLSY